MLYCSWLCYVLNTDHGNRLLPNFLAAFDVATLLAMNDEAFRIPK